MPITPLKRGGDFGEEARQVQMDGLRVRVKAYLKARKYWQRKPCVRVAPVSGQLGQ